MCVLVCAVVLVSAPSQLLPLADMELPALKDEMQARGQKPLQEGKGGLVERLTLLRESDAPDVGRADPTWSTVAEQVKWTVSRSMYLREIKEYTGKNGWNEAKRNYLELARAAAAEARTTGRTYDPAGNMN